jgi:hypothetical protein
MPWRLKKKKKKKKDQELEDGDADFDSDKASGEEDLLESIAFTEAYHDCSSTQDVDDF